MNLFAPAQRKLTLLWLLQCVLFFVRGSGIWPSPILGLTVYIASTIVMIIAFFIAKESEEADPENFVRFLKLTALTFAAIALGMVSTRSSGVQSLSEDSWQLYSRLLLPLCGYLLASWSLLGLLRVVERRPSLAILFVWNAAVMIFLSNGMHVMIILSLATLSALLLLREKWIAAYATLFLAFGAHVPGLFVLPLYMKFHAFRLKKEKQARTFSFIAMLYLLGVLLLTYVGGHMERGLDIFPFTLFWYTPFEVIFVLNSPIYLGVLVLAFLACGVLAWFAQTSGKDSLLYGLVLIYTIITAAMFPLDPTAIILPLALAAVFRSIPQLWLAFCLGLIITLTRFTLNSASTVWLTSMAAIFLLLMIAQLRNARKETGFFSQVELEETKQSFG